MDRHNTHGTNKVRKEVAILLARVKAMVEAGMECSKANPAHFSREFRHVVAACLHAGANEEEVLNASGASHGSLVAWKSRYASEARVLIKELEEPLVVQEDLFRRLPLVQSADQRDSLKKNSIQRNEPEYTLVLAGSITITTGAGGLTAELANFISKVRSL